MNVTLGMDNAKDILQRQLGQRVKEMRALKNMTQQDLALAADKDFQSIARLEQGRINPSFFYLLEISAGLETDVSTLLKDFKLTN